MSAHKANSQRIAKNMLVLYFRMIFQMVVYLYSSRVLLAQLGLVDYGIYDVVAGFVLVLSFLNNTMTSSTQRFVTYALGSTDVHLEQRVFNVSLTIHFVLALGIVLLGETAGLWYIYHQLQIPAERFEAALFVFQSSLFVAFLTIFSVPYNAMIIAHERMTAFAYISIADVSMKLLIVLTLPYFAGDPLKTYALLLAFETLLVRIVYACYCARNFHAARFRCLPRDPLYREMIAFAGWSSFGNLAYVANTQGTNLLLNWLGGPVLGPIYNASRGVAFQVQSAINAFVSAFQTAINPQITKSYAQGELNRTHQLVLISSRISFCLIFIMVFPILLEAPFFLGLWLKQVPEYAVVFVRLLIIAACIDAMANALCIAADATGRVKRFNLIGSIATLSTLPLGVCFYFLFDRIEGVYWALLLSCAAALLLRAYLGRSLYGLSLRAYCQQVFRPIALLLLFCLSLPICLEMLLEKSTLSSLIIVFTALLWTALGIWYFGLRSNERSFALHKFRSLMARFRAPQA